MSAVHGRQEASLTRAMETDRHAHRDVTAGM
jgi:hypothetical protein